MFFYSIEQRLKKNITASYLIFFIVLSLSLPSSFMRKHIQFPWFSFSEFNYYNQFLSFNFNDHCELKTVFSLKQETHKTHKLNAPHEMNAQNERNRIKMICICENIQNRNAIKHTELVSKIVRSFCTAIVAQLVLCFSILYFILLFHLYCLNG